MYYLYIKTHKVTGLKYLGYTSARDPHAYKGSGKYWKRHLCRHGCLYDTTILLKSQSKNEIKETGIFFSSLFNVVESNDWANQKIEECDGGWKTINQNKEKYLDIRKNRGKQLGSGLKGTVAVIDKTGNRFRVPKDDPRLVSGELRGHTTGMLAAYDKNQNLYYVSKNDPRLVSGELKSNNAGKRYITDGKSRRLVYPNDPIPEGWYIGDNRDKYNQGKIWITNGIESKMVFPDSIPNGWKKGRTLKRNR